MRSVRVFYEKRGRMRFVSHLDMNRFFTRVLRKTEIPLWYTEGYNPHPYITFALPLSLGFESRYEIIEFRVMDDLLTDEEISARIAAVLPQDVRVIRTATAEMKVGEIALAEYELDFSDGLAGDFLSFLKSGCVSIVKKTKKGDVKKIEVSEKIVSASAVGNIVKLVLPAGNDNLNPQLLCEAFYDGEKSKTTAVGYMRVAVCNRDGNLFV